MNAAPRRVMVTGASGFIGAHLSDVLEAAGHQVHRVSRGRRRADSGRRWAIADVSSRSDVRELVDTVRPDVIVHLAGEVTGSRGIDAVAPTFDANLASTVHLLEATVRSRVGRLVLAGSLEEPDEEDPPGTVPVSPYAAAKWAASAYARFFFDAYDAPVTLARIFMVYGPGQRDETKLVPYVCRSLVRGQAPRVTSGARLVDWVHVDDVVSGLTAASFAEGLEGETLELGSGALTPVREVVERLHEILGGPTPKYGAVPERRHERVRAARRTAAGDRCGWLPHLSLAPGLQETAAWYQSHAPSEPPERPPPHASAAAS